MSKKRPAETVEDGKEENSTKKNKTSESVSAQILRAPTFSETQISRILAFNTKQQPKFSLDILLYPDLQGNYKSTDSKNFELFLKVLAATRNPPSAWPQIAHLNVEKFVVFDLYALAPKYVLSTNSANGTSLYAQGYARFYPYGKIYGTLRRNVTREVFDGEWSNKKTHGVWSPNYQYHALFQQAACIVQEYIQRLEILDDAEQLQGDGTETCLLIDPADLLIGDNGMLYHLPLVDGITSHSLFVPQFVRSLPTKFQRLRAALLLSLARFVYAFSFGKSLDSGFSVHLNDFDAWKRSIDASKFPTTTLFGTLAPVLLIKWLVDCMRNSLGTAEITKHAFFTELTTEMWGQSIPITASVCCSKRECFYKLIAPLKRVNNQQVVVNVDMQQKINKETKEMYVRKFDSLPKEQQVNCDIAMMLLQKVIDMFSLSTSYDYGFDLSFGYTDVAAVGVGVSREIVGRAYEALKHWNAFAYDEEYDMLKFSSESFKARNEVFVQTSANLLFVLVYWSAMNDVPVPYMLSPGLLNNLFMLSGRHVFSKSLDFYRATRPLVANKILSIDDDENKAALLQLGAEEDRASCSVRDVLSSYVTDNDQLRMIKPENCEIQQPKNQMLRHFARIVRLIYDDAESLVFLLTHRTYNTDNAKRIDITPEIAISLLVMENLKFKPLDVSMFDTNAESPTATDRPLTNTQILQQHEKNTTESSTLASYVAVELAKRKTCVYLIRWILSAQPAQLSKLWMILCGVKNFLKQHVTEVKFDDIEKFTAKIKAASSPLPSESMLSTNDKLTMQLDNISAALKEYQKVAVSKTRNSISVLFRPAASEDRYLLSPQFASCTSTLRLSMCHESYEKFAESMDAALADDVTRFTLDT